MLCSTFTLISYDEKIGCLSLYGWKCQNVLKILEALRHTAFIRISAQPRISAHLE